VGNYDSKVRLLDCVQNGLEQAVIKLLLQYYAPPPGRHTHITAIFSFQAGFACDITKLASRAELSGSSDEFRARPSRPSDPWNSSRALPKLGSNRLVAMSAGM
jgi:hypothetical protein